MGQEIIHLRYHPNDAALLIMNRIVSLHAPYACFLGNG